jgi:transcriptional regulator
MYIPKHNAVSQETQLWELMRQFNFALLITAPDSVPFATSIPFTPLEEQRTLSAHMAKANPQWQHLETAKEVLVVFQAEHALISSRWYEQTDVPTWNYATVHAYGTARILDTTETRAQLEALMQQHGHETEMDKYSPKFLEAMQNALVGFEIKITRLEGKFKLSQNRSAVDQKSVITQLEQQGELEQGIAARMQRNLKQTL